MDTIESNESYELNENKSKLRERRMSEIQSRNSEEKKQFDNIKKRYSEEIKRISEDSTSDDGRKSLDLINKLTKFDERESLKDNR